MDKPVQARPARVGRTYRNPRLSSLWVSHENAAHTRVAEPATADDARRNEAWKQAVADVFGAWNLILGFVILGLLIVAITRSG
jgi:uncharacterized membrane protein